MSDSMQGAKPVPVPDADSRIYWQGINDNKFLFQRCRSCGKAQFYSRSVCSHCQAQDLEWEQAKGSGKVASYSVVHRAPIPSFRDDTPYVLALIDLDEGFRFMCNVIHCDPDAVRLGSAVKVVFEAREGSNQKIPQVELA
jgi:uncharacterized OB-fold protein